MKAPVLERIPEATANTSFSVKAKEVKQIVKASEKVVKRSYSLKPNDAAYVEKIALSLTMKQGKPVTASAALRIILDEHRNQS